MILIPTHKKGCPHHDEAPFFMRTKSCFFRFRRHMKNAQRVVFLVQVQVFVFVCSFVKLEIIFAEKSDGSGPTMPLCHDTPVECFRLLHYSLSRKPLITLIPRKRGPPTYTLNRQNISLFKKNFARPPSIPRISSSFDKSSTHQK